MSRTVGWNYKGKFYSSTTLGSPCPKCGRDAIVPLPAEMLAEQPDGTTHFCLPIPALGGCNHGFSLGVGRGRLQDQLKRDRTTGGH